MSDLSENWRWLRALLLPPKDAPPPWIVFRRDGGWHVDWRHPEWKRVLRESMQKAMKVHVNG